MEHFASPILYSNRFRRLGQLELLPLVHNPLGSKFFPLS
ncbi:hypothetical protein OSCI_150002 [Kamptonema sp. PCC 6506]|nr:hypothetical protein OSCI_150002 [Kamptonema sp. PCC 6506]